MRVVFSPDAQKEFEDAERYYNQQASQLGGEFCREIREALPRMRQWPLACPVERGEIRRLTLREPLIIRHTGEGRCPVN